MAKDKKTHTVLDLAHRINTPVTTIIGYLSLIEKRTDDAKVVSWLRLTKEEALKISKYAKTITGAMMSATDEVNRL